MLFSRDIPIDAHYDVIVCGAGPGGVSAAVSASRTGRKVLLIEQCGCIGGCWTSGMLGIALDMTGKGGIPREIAETLIRQNEAQFVDASSYTYSIEAMKHLLERMAVSAGVEILLYSRVSDVLKTERRITALLIESYRKMAFTADYFVDGTGHGDLAALSGCSWEAGDPESSECQPGSLEALVTGIPESWVSDIHNPVRKAELRELLRSAGMECSYQSPLLFRLVPNGSTWNLAVNHQYDIGIQDPAGISRAAVQARDEINRAVAALRTIEGWENIELVATGEQIGLRDGRRVKGMYRLCLDDALQGRCFDDGISYVNFPFDVHSLKHSPGTSQQNIRLRSRPFQIPLRCLLAHDIDNLFLSGRCISGDFYAHSAYRMTNTASATGEAAGIAVSMMRAGGINKEIRGEKVKAEMISRGYML